MNTAKKLFSTFALIILAVLPVSPASAHTEIDHTSPSEGSSVAAGVQTVSVVFTDKILNLDNSSEIVITNEAGDNVEVGCVSVENTSLSVDAFLPTAGVYKVVWRTVAEDGHPISEAFKFNVTGSADKGDFISCQDSAAQGTAVIAEPKASSTKEATPKADYSWVFYLAVAAAIGIAVVVSLRRKRTKD